MSSNFEGKTVLVFGASKGIGLATAQMFSEHGATVVLAARSKEIIEKETSKINSNGGKSVAIKCDVSKYNDINSCIEFCIKEFKSLDIVINNAGVIEPLTFLADSEPTLWSQAIDINVKGVYYAVRAVAPHMKKNGGGIIINMSSGAANSILEGWSHYCASKSAVKKITEIAHKELSNDNIRIVGLSPGTVATDMMRKIKDSNINAVSNLDWTTHIPPEWAAKAVLFLCGSKGKQFAGQDFSIKTDEGRALVGLPL
jgi:NADP-dependent 3-hydroxy acid dehydrogenase YdfG